MNIKDLIGKTIINVIEDGYYLGQSFYSGKDVFIEFTDKTTIKIYGDYDGDVCIEEIKREG